MFRVLVASEEVKGIQVCLGEQAVCEGEMQAAEQVWREAQPVVVVLGRRGRLECFY